MTNDQKPAGRVLLCNPQNGDAIIATDYSLFRSLVLDGWQPIGPNGKALAAKLRAAQAAQAA